MLSVTTPKGNAKVSWSAGANKMLVCGILQRWTNTTSWHGRKFCGFEIWQASSQQRQTSANATQNWYTNDLAVFRWAMFGVLIIYLSLNFISSMIQHIGTTMIQYVLQLFFNKIIKHSGLPTCPFILNIFLNSCISVSIGIRVWL